MLREYYIVLSCHQLLGIVAQIKAESFLSNFSSNSSNILCGRGFYVEPTNVEGILYCAFLSCGGLVSPKISTGFLQVSGQTMLASPTNTINVKLIQAST
jgi:hypothetical protein